MVFTSKNPWETGFYQQKSMGNGFLPAKIHGKLIFTSKNPWETCFYQQKSIGNWFLPAKKHGKRLGNEMMI
jgi:hypothetical protein